MKKTKIITNMTLIAAAVASFVGCDNQQYEVKRCVDQNNQMLDEKDCETAQQARATYVRTGNDPFPVWWYYHFIYGGNGGYTRGSIVTGGSERPTPGFESIPASRVSSGGFRGFGGGTVTRGGFGSIGFGAGE